MTTPSLAPAALSLRARRAPPRAASLLLALALTGGASAEPVELPLRAVTLYRSGVAYFERSGEVGPGDAATLPLHLAHLNDVLRSLVVLDPGGDSPPSVSYTSAEPLARLLDGYQVDVRRVNTLAELLSQLRGVELELTTAEGPVSGPLISVE